MNDVSLLSNKLNAKLVLIEKPYFFTDGKKIRSEQFPECKKMYLQPVEGASLEQIIKALNKEHKDKYFAIIMVGRGGLIAKTEDEGKVTIQCLML